MHTKRCRFSETDKSKCKCFCNGILHGLKLAIEEEIEKMEEMIDQIEETYESEQEMLKFYESEQAMLKFHK